MSTVVVSDSNLAEGGVWRLLEADLASQRRFVSGMEVRRSLFCLVLTTILVVLGSLPASAQPVATSGWNLQSVEHLDFKPARGFKDAPLNIERVKIFLNNGSLGPVILEGVTSFDSWSREGFPVRTEISAYALNGAKTSNGEIGTQELVLIVTTHEFKGRNGQGAIESKVVRSYWGTIDRGVVTFRNVQTH